MPKKILMATMGLDIGGAETHIVELSKELHKRGFDVIVASNGGVYEPELAQFGIRHFSVPMNRRSIVPMIKSYFLLGRIIRREKPDVVHAHARIPGFICHLLQKRMKFPFVATAHWVFETSGMQGSLTRWGQKTIAVSEDIKAYLKENYKVRDEDIFVTINGIATDKFSSQVSGESILAEFDIDAEMPVICTVSRLDLDRALAAETLIDAAPELKKVIGDFVLLIVGDGTEFARLGEKAAALAKAMGKSRIIMAGARTDINEFIAVGDVFVGVSRAALEAMACEKPVILAGNEGYEGIFSTDKLERAVKSNFCCRGSEKVTKARLVEDLAKIFSATADERAVLGAAGRKVILDNYSVGRMADDSIRAYNAVLTGRVRVVMSGYFGFENTGDESILQTIHRSVAAMPEVGSITVLSRRPEETRLRYGYQAIHRMNIFAVLRALEKCDVLISGGGSLLQDKTSTRSILYYLFVIRLAQRKGKKVMIYANGIGPVDKEKNRLRVYRALSGVDQITLRDAVSARELVSMGIPEEKLHVTVDPVFKMAPASRAAADKILSGAGVPADKPIVVVCVRKWPGDFHGKLASICDRIYDVYGYTTVFLAMQLPADVEIGRKVASGMARPYVIVEQACTGPEMMAVLSRAEFVLSMRLHALIFAAAVCVPTVGLVYDPKLENYLDMLSMPSAGSVEEMDLETAWRAVEKVAENREQLSESLRIKLPELKALAEENEKYLRDLIG